MADEEKIGRPWDDAELDAIVADYFDMLASELGGGAYVKSHHSKALMEKIGRTHRSVEFPKWLERMFVRFGVCSLETPPFRWVCVHRMHHQKSDVDGDPHSPVGHFFWGHMQWIYSEDPRMKSMFTYEKYIPDLLMDPWLRNLHKRNRWFRLYLAHVGESGELLGVALEDGARHANDRGHLRARDDVHVQGRDRAYGHRRRSARGVAYIAHHSRNGQDLWRGRGLQRR